MTTCLHCGKPVRLATHYGSGGSYWTHSDGYEECAPRYAAPNFVIQEYAS